MVNELMQAVRGADVMMNHDPQCTNWISSYREPAATGSRSGRRRWVADQIGALQPRSFDLVVVDAPCSNTGVFARRAEARWRFDEKKLTSLANDQRLLLKASAEFVHPSGRLIYSTCSIEPEECGDAARRFAKTDSRMKLIEGGLTLPDGMDDISRWCDGGYLAVFEAS